MGLVGVEVLDWLARIAGLGGLAAWWDRWRNRPEIAVRFHGERSDERGAEAELEIEDRSEQLSSLQPAIYLDGFTPKKERMTYQFKRPPSDAGE